MTSDDAGRASGPETSGPPGSGQPLPERPTSAGPRSEPSGNSGPPADERVAGGHPDIRYRREMGVTDDDFWRILPKAMGGHGYRIDGRTVHGSVNGGTVEIVLGPQQERRIALLRLPFSEVSFTFRGVSADDQQTFKRHFDLYFQRGGG